MLRRNRVAVSSETKEKATWPTSRAFATEILRRLRPDVRASSFSVSATLRRDDRSAGMVPNRKLVNNDSTSAKTKTVASIFGVMKLVATSAGRKDHNRREPSYPTRSP